MSVYSRGVLPITLWRCVHVDRQIMVSPPRSRRRRRGLPSPARRPSAPSRTRADDAPAVPARPPAPPPPPGRGPASGGAAHRSRAVSAQVAERTQCGASTRATYFSTTTRTRCATTPSGCCSRTRNGWPSGRRRGSASTATVTSAARAEYNLALGDRRAGSRPRIPDQSRGQAGSDPDAQLGKEAPFCRDSGESCWSQS